MRPARLFAALCTLATCAAASVAQDVPDGLLYCAHFDNYAAASWAAGSRTPTIMDPTLQLTDGRFGRALSLVPGQSLAIVADDGNFRPDQGTVEMWVRPDWDGDDGQVHVLFSARVERGNYLECNKLATNLFGVATGAAGVGRYVRIDTDSSPWRAGEWRHVAFTWGDGRLALYLDGELIGEEGDSIPPRRAMPTIVISGRWDGAIDELAIWDEPRTQFALDAPIDAPELEAPEMTATLPPPVTDLDRCPFDLPDAARGYLVVPKYYVDELDPAQAPAELPDEPRLSAFAARGEWQTMAAVVYATRDLSELTLTPSALAGPEGATIPATDLQVRAVRRVMQLPRPRVDDAERVPAAALLDPANPFDLPAEHFKEIALTVHVPDDAPAGDYAGTLAISAAGGDDLAIPVAVEVLPFALEPSERKAFGMYYQMELAPEVRERVRAELQDLRDHHVSRLFSYLHLRHELLDGEIVTSYDELAEGLALLAELGFCGEIVVMDEFRQIAALLGHKDINEGDRAESLAGDERYAEAVERAIRGLDPLRARYPEFEIVLTHMDEVMGERRRYLFMELARPIRRVPEQRIYITMHTLPQDYVPGAIADLDPWMDIRCYNGYAMDRHLQAGGSWQALGEELASAGDEGWLYFNPHRSWYVAEWARIINGLYLWTSPLSVHCPYRYRTMRSWPLPFIHNMAYTVMSPEDFVTPIATRNWEGFRLGAQDTWYLCTLEDLVARATERGVECADARTWLDEVRAMMPTSNEVQTVSRPEYGNYPVVSTIADRLTGADYERLRRTTADHIVALRAALGGE